ncbi:MAG: helix-turn-helix domain-containing protein [Acidobacteriota bacterium]|nr:MAG: helix-turn-helix domain-containing protein [Acidobacteriota bacterium]
MNRFAEAFRRARLNSGLTFREIAATIEKSIGYVSDIDSGRKNPPERTVVEKIEKLLGVTDGHLANLADEVRMNIPKSLKVWVDGEPRLGEFLKMSQILLREDDGFTSVLDKYVEEMRTKILESGLDAREAD